MGAGSWELGFINFGFLVLSFELPISDFRFQVSHWIDTLEQGVEVCGGMPQDHNFESHGLRWCYDIFSAILSAIT